MKKTLVLIDAHAIIHRAYHALPDFASSTGEPTGALYGLSTMLMGILEKFNPEYVAGCFDLPHPTYRHEAYADYKAGRKKSDDNLKIQLQSSREIFKAFSIPIYELAGFEADDMLGTIVEKILKNEAKKRSSDELNKEEIRVVIASGDMDTLQLVVDDKVVVFTLRKGIKDTVLYDEDAVKERFGFTPKSLPDYKGLRGDPSDNIIGIPGIGEKTATTLVGHFSTIEKMYESIQKGGNKEFKKLGITDRVYELLEKGKEEAEFSKMLATIRRDAPIEFSLPEKSWGEECSFSQVENIFKRYEFRSLIPRARQFFEKKNSHRSSLGLETGIDADSVNHASLQENKKVNTQNASNFGTVSKKEVSKIDLKPESKAKQADVLAEKVDKLSDEERGIYKKAQLAVWILNSDITHPSFDDIYNYSKSEDLGVALVQLEKDIHAKGLDFVYQNIEVPLIKVLEKMQINGIKLDVLCLKKMSKEFHGLLSDLQSKIWSMAGEEFNVSSPKQLGHILFDVLGLKIKGVKKTSTGALSTKESELEKLKGAHSIIDLIMEYRELSKLVTTYIDTLPMLADKESRVHTTFLQTGTTTGRLASQDPNIQNIPIKSEQGRRVRKAFVAEKGFTLISCDYSQIELRIAAILSKDQGLIDIFKRGIDVHTGVAAQVFKVPIECVTKDMRRQAKVINFGILYGMGVNALKANLGSTREEAQSFYNEYFQTFSRLAEYLEETKRFAKKNGYTETMFGRRRYFRGISSPLPFIRASAERMAINAPIQGTATADIVKLGMITIHNYIEKQRLQDKIKMLLQVHDELVFEIQNEYIEDILPTIKKLMEEAAPKEKLEGVPLSVSIKIGLNWDDMASWDKKG